MVDLNPLGKYQEGKPGQTKFQEEVGGKWHPFEFFHLLTGDYVLVFNSANVEDADFPFHRTFYPHSPDLAGSQIIHVAAGQQILDADIRVDNPTPTRQIAVRLVWGAIE